MLKKKYRTDALYPKTNFLTGMGSVVDTGGNYFKFNYSQTDEEADANALESDWGMIGQDIYNIIENTPINSIHIV